MIEINLIPGSSGQNLENIGGFNFSLINVKLVVFSIIALYGVEVIVASYFDGELDELKAQQSALVSEQRGVSTKLRALADVKKQVENLNKQEAILAKRIDVVKEIVEKRQNPFKVLKYIAENTPKEIWLDEIVLDDRSLKLVGSSKSWKSIGEFLQNLKTSIFFDTNVSYVKPEGVVETFKGQRVEAFEINANVVRFQ